MYIDHCFNIFLCLIVAPRTTGVKDTSTYTQISTTNDSQTTMLVPTEISYSTSVWGSPATEAENSLIYTSLFTTKQSATGQKATQTYTHEEPRMADYSEQPTREPINPPLQTTDDMEHAGQPHTRASTNQVPIVQSTAMLTTNKKSDLSSGMTHIGKVILNDKDDKM